MVVKCTVLVPYSSRSFYLKTSRFGLIMSLFAVKEIAPNEEILVNYNYDVKLAPDWYRELWKQHIGDLDDNLKRLHSQQS